MKITIFVKKISADCSLLPCQRMPCPQILWRELSQIATKPRNSRKFSPSKVFRYTVCICQWPSNWHHHSNSFSAKQMCRCLCIVHVCVIIAETVRGLSLLVCTSHMVVDIHTHTLIPLPPHTLTPHTLTPGLHCTVNSKFLPGLRKPICASVG